MKKFCPIRKKCQKLMNFHSFSTTQKINDFLFRSSLPLPIPNSLILNIVPFPSFIPKKFEFCPKHHGFFICQYLKKFRIVCGYVCVCAPDNKKIVHFLFLHHKFILRFSFHVQNIFFHSFHFSKTFPFHSFNCLAFTLINGNAH